MAKFNFVVAMAYSAPGSAGCGASSAQPKYMAGGRGMSESTQDTREQEQRRFDEFLRMKNMKPYERMNHPDDLCSRKMIEAYKDYLSEEYKMSNGKHYSAGTALIFLNARMQNIKDKLKDFKLEGKKPYTTPHVQGDDHELGEVLTGDNANEYRSMVGALLWVCIVRPDIANTVNKLSQHMKELLARIRPVFTAP